ncbi:MAG: M6 family metalloprotease domain-containing protein [Bacteroidales bacterium]|nr:M6 family metalloprotease domain-containing protein [Bacteroidales bacterium]
MKKLLVSIYALMCLCLAANAVPAYRGLLSYTQPDGTTIRIRLHGDEFCHWVTDASGQVLEKDADGYYRAVSETQLSTRRAAAALRRAQINSVRSRSAAKAGVASGQKHFLVILVQFSDVKFASESTAQQDFYNLLNQQGYSVNGGTGSARDFYYDNSHGTFEPVFDVYGPVTLTNKMSYYGGNDSSGNDLRPEYAVKEGCEKVNSQFNVDFSQFDNDGDGEVDLVFMYYAGYGEADYSGSGCENTIWPHQWELSSGDISLTLDGKTINKYACTNELVGYGDLAGQMCGIGTACHEFGHAMGLPDFYDTDYDSYNGLSAGMFCFSTMDSGSYNNEGRTPPYFTMEERILLGWTDEGSFREFTASGTYNIGSVADNIAYRTMTDQDGEYFVYECRGNNGWDAGLPAHGLIVTHVDKSSRKVTIRGTSSNISVTASSLWSDWETYNSINENGSHPCCYVVPAAGQDNLMFGYKYYSQYQTYYYEDEYNEWIPFPTTRNSVSYNSYTAKSWNGVNSDIALSNITYSGSQVTLYASVPSNTLNYTVIANPGGGVYTAGGIFALELEQSEAQPVAGVEWYLDDEPVGTSISGGSVVLSAGTHLVEAHITLAGGESKIIELTLEAR